MKRTSNEKFQYEIIAGEKKNNKIKNKNDKKEMILFFILSSK